MTHPSPQDIWLLDDDVDLCALICARLQQCGWINRAFPHPSIYSQASRAANQTC